MPVKQKRRSSKKSSRSTTKRRKISKKQNQKGGDGNGPNNELRTQWKKMGITHNNPKNTTEINTNPFAPNAPNNNNEEPPELPDKRPNLAQSRFTKEQLTEESHLTPENEELVKSYESHPNVARNLKEYKKYTKEIIVPAGDMPHSLIFYPMSIGDRVIGLITVQSFQKNALLLGTKQARYSQEGLKISNIETSGNFQIFTLSLVVRDLRRT